MKYWLFLFTPFLGFTDFSFAKGSFLDEELVALDKYQKQLPSKTAKYTGKSKIVGDRFDYVKLPTIHQYNWSNVISTRFSAFLPTACAPQILEDTIDQFLPGHQRIYALHVQSLYPNVHDNNPVNGRVYSPHDPFALKPHYFVHHDAPTINEGKDYATQVQWTVVPGVGGLVEPARGKFQDVGLLSDQIDTHGAPGSPNGVSGDVMHLKGITIAKKDENDESSYALTHNNVFYSLVAFTNDNGQKEAVITCHVTLRNYDIPHPADTEVGYFYEAFNNAHTLREGIQGLDEEEYFRPILPELKKFLRWDAPENLPPVEEPIPPIEPIIEQPVPVEEPIPPVVPVIVQQPVPVEDFASPKKRPRKASVKTQKRNKKAVSQSRRKTAATPKKRIQKATKRVTTPRVKKAKLTRKERRIQTHSLKKARVKAKKRPIRTKRKNKA